MRREGRKKGESGERRLTDVNHVDLLGFLHELECNIDVLTLLDWEARVCLRSAVEERVEGWEGWRGGVDGGRKGEYKDELTPQPGVTTTLQW